MEIERIYCEDCGYKLKSKWFFCVRCANSLTKNLPIICGRCHQVIDDPSPNFCPYCKASIQEKHLPPVLDIKPDLVTHVHEKHELASKTKFQSDLSSRTIFSSLKLDIKAMERIANDNSFNLLAMVVIFLTAISYMITTYFLHFILDVDVYLDPETFMEGAVLQCSLLLMIGIFGILINSVLYEKPITSNFLRLTGSYAFLFLLKDVLMLFLIFYIRFFQSGPSGYGTASNIYLSASIILILYFLVYITVFTKHYTQTNTSLSVFVTIIVFIMSVAFISSYIGPTIRLLQFL